MDKRDRYSPKNISKRAESGGLGKLCYFCAACDKQFRTKHGMVRHCRDEPHSVQVELFNANSQRFLNERSQGLKRGYLDILKRRYKNKQVDANVVYQEYIKDPTLPHMNGTHWMTLSSFVHYLEKQGLCSVERKGKHGWLINCIDTNPEVVYQEEQKLRREKTALDDQDREGKMVEQLIERDRARANENTPHYTELFRSGEGKVAFSFAANVDKTKNPTAKIRSDFSSMVKVAVPPSSAVASIIPRKRSRPDSECFGSQDSRMVKKAQNRSRDEDESGNWVQRIKLETSRGRMQDGSARVTC